MRIVSPHATRPSRAGGRRRTPVAQLSLGEARWRMLRLALRKRRFRFEDVRNMTRRDRGHFDWFVDNGFFAAVGGEVYALTDKGRASADLGFYEYEPPRRR